MKLGMLSWSSINMPWYKFYPIWGRFGYMLLTNRSFSQQAWWFSVRNVPPLWTKHYPMPLIAFNFFSCQHSTTSLMVSVGNVCPTFGDKTISIASYCFQKISRVNIEQQECCVNFCDFSGFVWTFLCINWVFNAFMCIIQIWTTCTCSSAYKLVEKSNLCPWVHA